MAVVSEARYIIGDTRDVTATMADGSVDLVMTSPPFLALRSYLPADHPDKSREIGSEPTPAAFIDMLLELTAEWGRVLAPHGSICVELGDTYSGGWVGDSTPNDPRANAEGGPLIRDRRRNSHEKRNKLRESNLRGWPLPKSKALIPELYRIALAYGINPLTGKPSPAGQWRVRNVVTWCRPNPPVGALGDKFRPATSDMVVATRTSNRYFDLDAVRSLPNDRTNESGGGFANRTSAFPGETRNGERHTASNPAGAPPLDYWVIVAGGYEGSHYAVFPPELCRIPVLSMCPQQVCTRCGEPRRRIVAVEYAETPNRALRDDDDRRYGSIDGKRHNDHRVMSHETLGWSDCGHDSWRRGVVFDPFAGSGTTLLVANGHGRDAVGIDIDERNADLAVERCGMFLTVEHHQSCRPAAAGDRCAPPLPVPHGLSGGATTTTAGATP